jgi:hypothetical protein
MIGESSLQHQLATQDLCMQAWQAETSQILQQNPTQILLVSFQ